MIDGILLLVVAALYFALINSTTLWLEERISPLEKAQVMPLFLMNHIAVGILMIPLALSTFYCAWGVKKGQHWSRVISLINGVSLLSLPVVLSSFMGAQYYGSFLFLLATVLIVVVGITMLVPLVWFPKDIPQTPVVDVSKQTKGTT
ncbi:MAG TPA: hypothetical protein DGH68_02250 [Bacteroidetes bacterium]|nr:hypothetical protein [Bacteroidota bacterium]